MKRLAILFLGLGLICFAYFRSQDGRIRINKQSASVMLLKGGYRSWGFAYSDGEMMLTNGQWSQVSFISFDAQGNPTGVRPGYRWPKYYHADVREFLKHQAP